MKKIINLVKNPMTWIVCAVVCSIGVVIWAFTGRPDVIEDLKD